MKSDNKYSELVSIIIPAYNAELLVERCIDSVKKQTYKNIEVLIIDDGSEDETYSICSNIAKEDNRINLIHKKNGGVSSARNMGLDLCRGEYVVFVDVDDELTNFAIEEMLCSIMDDNVDLVICGYNGIQNDSNRSICLKEQIVVNSDKVVEFMMENYLSAFVSAPWGKMYKKTFIGNDRFDETIALGEDLKFNVQYFSKINSVKINSNIVYNYYDVDGSLSKRFKKTHFDSMDNIYSTTIDIINHQFIIIPESIKNVNYKMFSTSMMFIIHAFNSFSTIEEKEYILYICNNNNVKKSLKQLPPMSFSKRVFAFAAKNKMINLLYLLSYIKCKYID